MAQSLRVAVTGGSGKVGRQAIKSLKAAGHKPVNFDLQPSPDGVRTTLADFADFGQCMSALTGVDTMGGPFDAVVHLAGIPGPGRAPDHTIFQNNTLSTYNVFSACQRLGIKRIAWASSETVLGLPFTTPPDFAPVDETHPRRPEWTYSMTKHLGETLAEEFARWVPDISITSLRFSNVFSAEDYATIAAIQARPDVRKMNLWGYVDARDCGEACRLALETAAPGHAALIVAAADTVVDIPSAELMARHFPDTPIRGELAGFQSILSTEKAARLIGYRPRYSWRDPQLG
jgi:nucleoside-diphosphate-sugar epimerase